MILEDRIKLAESRTLQWRHGTYRYPWIPLGEIFSKKIETEKLNEWESKYIEDLNNGKYVRQKKVHEFLFWDSE